MRTPDVPSSYVLAAYAHLRSGARDAMEQDLRAALQDKRIGIFTRGHGALEDAVLSAMREHAGDFFYTLTQPAFSNIPPRDRRELLAALLRADPSAINVRTEAAQLAASQGSRSEALLALEFAVRQHPSPRALANIVDIASQMTRADSPPERRRQALRVLQSTALLHPEPPTLLKLIDIARRSADPSLGTRREALAVLENARRATDSAEILKDVAHAYQSAGAYDEERGLLADMLRTRPTDAGLLSDLGVCDFLAGRESAAIDDFSASIRVEPRFLPAYLSLAAIYEREKRYDKALRTYESAQAFEAAGDKTMARIMDEGRRKARVRVAQRP